MELVQGNLDRPLQVGRHLRAADPRCKALHANLGGGRAQSHALHALGHRLDLGVAGLRGAPRTRVPQGRVAVVGRDLQGAAPLLRLAAHGRGGEAVERGLDVAVVRPRTLRARPRSFAAQV